MTLKKNKIVYKNFSQNFNFDDSEYLTSTNCSLNYNVQSSKGYLTEGKGLKKLCLPFFYPTVPTEVETSSQNFNFVKIWYYSYYSETDKKQKYFMIAFGNDNYLYYSNLHTHAGKFYKIPNCSALSSVPDTINFMLGTDSVIGFASTTDNLLVWYCDKDPYLAKNTPRFKSICLHGDRLFAIDADEDNVVRYGATYNPLDWKKDISSSEDADKITLNDYKSNLQKLVSFNDFVYVFHDYGISKITSYNLTKKFYCTNIYNTTSKIYTNTVCVCGEYIYFLQEDGLYRLDKTDIKRIDFKFSDLFMHNQDEANSCYFDGKYYLACKLDFNDGEESTYNNSLVEFDFENNEFNIIKGIDIVSMLPINISGVNKIVIARRDKNILYELTSTSQIDSLATFKFWQSGQITFGTINDKKIIKDLHIYSKYDCDFTITSNKKTFKFSIKGQDKIQRVPINLVGNEFKFSLSSTADKMLIKYLEINYVTKSYD